MIVELLKYTFVLDVMDKVSTTRKFLAQGRIAKSDIPMYKLNYPRAFAALGKVHDAIAKILAEKVSREFYLQ